MSSTFGRLPTEIQIEIFNYISNKADLLECQLTCKGWSRPSSQALYKSITFDSRNINKVDGLRRTLNGDKKHLKGFVKHIRLMDSGENEEQYRTLLHFFADNCPNIRTAYLDCIAEDSFFLEELHHENWTHLENVSFGIYNRTKLAIEIAKQHQDTIKGLLFYESDIDEKDKRQEFKEKLARFKSLEKVSIFTKKSSYLTSFDNIIPNSLKSLELISRSLPHDRVPIIPYTVNLKEIIPYLNIKELKLNIPLSEDSSIRYLMHKFPKLEILQYNDFTTLSVSEDTREAFTDYLLNIKTLRLYYTLVCESDSPMDYYFIKKLIGNSRTKNFKKQPNFSVCFRPSWGSFIHKDYFSKETDGGVESYKITVGLEGARRLDYLKSFGTEFTELEITKSDGDELSLSQIFKHCPNLSRLDVKGFGITLDTSLKQNTMNLKSLKYFSYERFTSEILLRWFKFFPNLTELTFEGSKETTIDVSSIITAFPHLDCLKIVNTELFLSKPIKTSSAIKTLVLDKCKFLTSDLFNCLPEVHSLFIYISGRDVESNKLVLNMPETSLRGLSIYVDYSYREQSASLLEASLLIDDKNSDSQKLYHTRAGMMKKCTETEYECVISQDPSVFQFIIYCKQIPMTLQLSSFYFGIGFRAGTFAFML